MQPPSYEAARLYKGYQPKLRASVVVVNFEAMAHIGDMSDFSFLTSSSDSSGDQGLARGLLTPSAIPPPVGVRASMALKAPSSSSLSGMPKTPAFSFGGHLTANQPSRLPTALPHTSLQPPPAPPSNVGRSPVRSKAAEAAQMTPPQKRRGLSPMSNSKRQPPSLSLPQTPTQQLMGTGSDYRRCTREW